MLFPPANVDETTKLIVESGIGRIAFNDSYWPRSFRTEIINGRDVFGECKFWVQADDCPIARSRIIQVVMQHPDVPNAEMFTAERGIGFGSGSIWPLDRDQQILVERLAKQWLRGHSPTKNTKRHIPTH